jgi:hypothetical protein
MHVAPHHLVECVVTHGVSLHHVLVHPGGDAPSVLADGDRDIGACLATPVGEASIDDDEEEEERATREAAVRGASRRHRRRGDSSGGRGERFRVV